MRYLLALALCLAALNSSPTPTPKGCAHKLGIAYSVDDGATERLDDFALCLAR